MSYYPFCMKTFIIFTSIVLKLNYVCDANFQYYANFQYMQMQVTEESKEDSFKKLKEIEDNFQNNYWPLLKNKSIVKFYPNVFVFRN